MRKNGRDECLWGWFTRGYNKVKHSGEYAIVGTKNYRVVTYGGGGSLYPPGGGGKGFRQGRRKYRVSQTRSEVQGKRAVARKRKRGRASISGGGQGKKPKMKEGRTRPLGND